MTRANLTDAITAAFAGTCIGILIATFPMWLEILLGH